MRQRSISGCLLIVESGLHDATWRDKFGGDIYYSSGSHGCVNLPYQKAAVIYENIYAGMPVICYY